MQAGQRVRLKSAPDRVGVLTGDFREIRGRKRWLVQFTDNNQYFPEQNLEPVEEQQGIHGLLAAGSFGKVINLRNAITHSRLTGSLADIIYSMEASNTEFFPHQFKPVLNFLDSPSNGILIADEVGLGKTIEAGLIWTELQARVNANKLLVICPAVLREKWASELFHRFGIKADICNAAELLDRLEQQEARPNDGFAIVCSIQGIRPPKGWENDKEILSNTARLARYIQEKSAEKELFDCVIIDEAHYLRNPESQTHRLGQLIRPAAVHIVLLSATPIQLRSDDLFHLLNIIDNENFEFKDSFDDLLYANRPLVGLASALRGGKCTPETVKAAVNECLSHHLLRNNRQLSHLAENMPSQAQLDDVNFRIQLANQVERINLLGSIISRTRKRDVHQKKVVRSPQAQSIVMTDIEKAFYQSVTEEVRKYCTRYGLFEGFLLTIPQRQMCSSIPAALRSWLKKIDAFDDDIVFETGGDTSSEERTTPAASQKAVAGPLVQALASIAKRIASYEQLRTEDSKYTHLLQLLRRYWKDNPGCKVILFSYYRETLHYLKERLQEDNIPAHLMMGGMKTEKADILESFRSDGPDILLSTEVLSEGVDLQFSAALINYDLPWNPMRVEQRIGRIDRIGQEAEQILIWNLFYQDTLDDRIYSRLFERLDIFQSALGDMEAILGAQVRQLTYDLLSHKLTPDQEAQQIDQTAAAIENVRLMQEELEEEAAGLAAHGDYVLNKVAAAMELRRYIDGHNLWIYVRDYLKTAYPGCRITERNKEPLTIDIELAQQAKVDMLHFMEHTRLLGKTALGRTAAGVAVTCCFSNKVDFGSHQHEAINQSHPLVRFVASQRTMEDFHPLTVTEVDQKHGISVTPGQYLILCKRWSTRGARTVERLVYRGICTLTGTTISDEDSEKIINAAVHHGTEWLDVNATADTSLLIERYEDIEIQLDDEFAAYCSKMQMENEDRIEFLINTLNGQTQRQINSRQEAIYKLEEAHNYKMIKLNEAMIKKLEEHRDMRILQFREQRTISSEPQDVILSFINVKH